MENQTFAEIGRTEAIRQLFEGTPFKCGGCSFAPKAGSEITSASKVLLEGIDFDLVYFPLKHLGYKGVVEVTGELQAALAHPRTLSVRLGVSAKLDLEHIRTLWAGVVSAATEYGYSSVSLDLQPSRNGLSVSLSATGERFKLTAVHRPSPKSKDLICVSGPLGAAYLGMRVLEEGKAGFEKGIQDDELLSRYKMLVGSYLKPDLSAHTLDALEETGIIPACGYFIDRGLSDAVLRLTRDTGLGAKVYADRMPFEGGTFEYASKINADPVSAAMNGGDDCRILFVIPLAHTEKFRHDFQTFDIIGHLALPECGAALVTPEGVELPMSAQGW